MAHGFSCSAFPWASWPPTESIGQLRAQSCFPISGPSRRYSFVSRRSFPSPSPPCFMPDPNKKGIISWIPSGKKPSDYILNKPPVTADSLSQAAYFTFTSTYLIIYHISLWILSLNEEIKSTSFRQFRECLY